MLKGLTGKSIVVTGAGAGIGAATCRRLVAEGAQVVAADIDLAAAEAIAKEIGSNAVALRADVSTPDGAAACVSAAVDAFGRLDAFHANAGVEGRAHLVSDFDLAMYELVFGVNVRGAFLCASAALRRLTSQGDGGGILFTSSLASLQGTPSMAIYTASKHAVHGLVRCLAREVSPGIRVNALAPGVVDTRMMRSLEQSMGAAGGTDAATLRAGLEAAVPMRRYASVDEIAATAAWILSDEVPYVHGETITVGGGLTP
ncbi:SDR family NAD(P)-dependent oxidoreductase [Aeromicrobium sp.]|uniref:SDR family NAD(P)-dependent oxidoreductase n=1 Tax=Aeromicrobium sp. TaxID=1871063 RepID=UPI0019974E34|nr:SDR family oxidoreductase [Aeromicrobium sp.]MBC7632248.1 SDR family oxidoreductase [Aeromicrobium sp.]